MTHLYAALLSAGLMVAAPATPVSACDLPFQSVADTSNIMARTEVAASPTGVANLDDFNSRFSKKVGEKAVQRAEKIGLAAGAMLGAKIGFSVGGPVGGVLGGLIGGILGEALGSVFGEQLFLPPSVSPWRR